MSAKAVNPLVILIAEDDPNDVLLIRRVFTKAGIRALTFFVSNGVEAIRYLRGDAPFNDRGAYPFPNLLLVDLKMPEAGGLDVLEYLATLPQRSGLRAVLFSSCVAPEDMRRATSLGAFSCMTKPLNPSDLLPILQDLPGL